MNITNLIREYNPETDTAFITNSWLKSYRESDFVKNITHTMYFSYHHSIVTGLLERCKTLVVANTDLNENQIYGYICYEVGKLGDTDPMLIIHYAYVKYPFRNMKIMESLIKHIENTETFNIKFATHNTYKFNKIKNKYNIIYNPYLIF